MDVSCLRISGCVRSERYRWLLANYLIDMGVYVNDVQEFTGSETADDESDRAPVGERLHGLASELDVDSVDEVCDLCERL